MVRQYYKLVIRPCDTALRVTLRGVDRDRCIRVGPRVETETDGPVEALVRSVPIRVPRRIFGVRMPYVVYVYTYMVLISDHDQDQGSPINQLL